MLVEVVDCFECGGDASSGEHVEGCTSEWLMSTYCDIVESLDRLPKHLLDKLSLKIYAENLEREMSKREFEFEEDD